MSSQEGDVKHLQRVTVFFVAAVIAMLLVGIAVIVWREHVRTDQVEKAKYVLCLEVEEIRTYARGAADRGILAIPTTDYYKRRADERRAAVKSLRAQRKTFSPPLDCVAFSKGDVPIPAQLLKKPVVKLPAPPR